MAKALLPIALLLLAAGCGPRGASLESIWNEYAVHTGLAVRLDSKPEQRTADIDAAYRALICALAERPNLRELVQSHFEEVDRARYAGPDHRRLDVLRRQIEAAIAAEPQRAPARCTEHLTYDPAPR